MHTAADLRATPPAAGPSGGKLTGDRQDWQDHQDWKDWKDWKDLQYYESAG